jgi:hypothetical protein
VPLGRPSINGVTDYAVSREASWARVVLCYQEDPKVDRVRRVADGFATKRGAMEWMSHCKGLDSLLDRVEELIDPEAETQLALLELFNEDRWPKRS